MKNTFWETVYSIEKGYGWGLFSVGHILWLVLGALCCAGVAVAYALAGKKAKRVMRVTIAVLLLANLTSDPITLAATGHLTVDHLPLHMCSIGGFIVAAHAFKRKHSDILAALTYAVSFPGAVLALLTPNWSVLPFLNFFGISSFVYHFLLITYPFMLIAGGYRPQFGHLRPALPFVVAAVALIFALNKLLGTDFLFINGGKTVGWLSAMSDIFGIYGYLWIFPVAVTLLWTIEFLPFYLAKRHSQTHKENEKEFPGNAETASDDRRETHAV